MNEIKESKFLIYETEEGKIDIDVILKDETIWLTQKSMAELFDVEQPAIAKHLINIYKEEELLKDSTYSKTELVQKEGTRNVKRNLEFYNLDAIIAVGYRVNSKKATQFRIWATNVLKSYIIKGYKLDKERLKNGAKFGKDYFVELLVEIREIRTSEYRVYKKILDIFEVTSVDYKKDSEEAYTFFKIVQNKLHFAITGKTAAELIYERVDANKEHTGLTTWKNAPDGKVYKFDVTIVKNYLSKEELNKLNSLTELFLIYAERQTENDHLITMKEWIEKTDELLKFDKKVVLNDSGNISHKQAIDKAHKEYEIFKVKQEQEYISGMDEFYEQYLKENKENPLRMIS